MPSGQEISGSGCGRTTPEAFTSAFQNCKCSSWRLAAVNWQGAPIFHSLSPVVLSEAKREEAVSLASGVGPIVPVRKAMAYPVIKVSR